MSERESEFSAAATNLAVQPTNSWRSHGVMRRHRRSCSKRMYSNQREREYLEWAHDTKSCSVCSTESVRAASAAYSAQVCLVSYAGTSERISMLTAAKRHSAARCALIPAYLHLFKEPRAQRKAGASESFCGPWLGSGVSEKIFRFCWAAMTCDFVRANNEKFYRMGFDELNMLP